MTLVNGQQLDGGRYTVEEQLGQGRFCITYLVKDKNDERFVIKTLNYDLPGLQTQSQTERDRLESKFWNGNRVISLVSLLSLKLDRIY